MNLSIATASCFAVRYVEYIIVVEVKVIMETKSIILELRDKAGLSQDELAEKYMLLVKLYHAGRMEKRHQTQKP